MLRRRQRLGAPGSLGGITLVEVLAVSAILAILVALLLPWTNRLVERSRQATCTANLRHLTRAFQLYIAENNGSFFLKRDDWAKDLRSYLEREDDWFKKAQHRQAGLSCPSVNALPGAQFNSGIYGVNYVFLNDIEGGTSESRSVPPTAWPVKLANVAKPSRAWVFTEAGRQLPGGSADVVPLGYVAPGELKKRPGPSVTSLVWPHAGERRNLAFLDGHVEALTWEEVDAFNGVSSTSPVYREFHGLMP